MTVKVTPESDHRNLSIQRYIAARACSDLKMGTEKPVASTDEPRPMRDERSRLRVTALQGRSCLTTQHCRSQTSSAKKAAPESRDAGVAPCTDRF